MKTLHIGRPEENESHSKYRHECCFAVDTLVMTPECPKPIQTFVEGDLVVTYDLKTNALVETAVEKVDIHVGAFDLRDVYVGKSSDYVRATAGHLFFDSESWVPCEDLRMVITAAGSMHSAYSFFSDRVAHAVYNLRTTKGTYLVGADAALVSGGFVKDLLTNTAHATHATSMHV